MADLYSQLNVARGASEAEIKKAYRKLAKELHPDKNKDNPKATERFSKVTRAYDILTDKDKRAQYDRGEIDEEGNPRMPFGFGGGGGPRRRRRRRIPRPQWRAVRIHRRRRGGGSFRPVRRAVRRQGRRGGGGGGPFGGFGRRSAPPQKGADVAYRLEVPFEDAARLAGQRVTLGSGKTLDIKLPPGVEDGTKIRLAGQGQPGPAGNGDAIVTIAVKPHRFFRREGDNIRLDLPVSIDEAVLGGKVRVPTVDGPVMLERPQGIELGQGAAPQGQGLHRQERPARRPAGHADGRRARRSRARRIPRRLERQGQDEPARGARRLGARCAKSPPNPRKQGASGSPGRRRISRRSASRHEHSRAWEVVKRVAVGVYSDGFIHAGNLAYLALLSLFPFVIVAAAIARLFGQTEEGMDAVNALLQTMPPDVADVLRTPIRDVIEARSGQPALARRAGRPVDHGQLHRDDPRHHPPRLWRQLSPAVLGISAGLGRHDHRRGGDGDDRVQRLDPALRACSNSWCG